MYILVQCNHATVKNAKCELPDDDPQLWMDDCMEFFFKTAKDAISYYHLIVNVAGRRVLLLSTEVVKDSEIQVATVSPTNESGGYGQEVFVPWKAFGLSHAPEAGTIWRLQVGREFHSWREQITCWAQVDDQFADTDKWGSLVFTGSKTDGKLPLPRSNGSAIKVDRCPVRVIEGQPFEMDITLAGKPGRKGWTLAGAFVSQAGRQVKLPAFPLASKVNQHRVWVQPAGLPAGPWRLQLWLAGKGSTPPGATRDIEVLPSPVTPDEPIHPVSEPQ